MFIHASAIRYSNKVTYLYYDRSELRETLDPSSMLQQSLSLKANEHMRMGRINRGHHTPPTTTNGKTPHPRGKQHHIHVVRNRGGVPSRRLHTSRYRTGQSAYIHTQPSSSGNSLFTRGHFPSKISAQEHWLTGRMAHMQVHAHSSSDPYST